MAGGIAIEELIERIGHEAVSEYLNNAVMNSTNSEVSSEEPDLPNNVAEIGTES